MKLTEHSWLLNPFVLAVAKRIYQKLCRVAWVGDYAEDDDLPVIAKHAGEAAYSLKGAYRKYPGRKLKETDFSMRGKFLVNHTQKKYVDIDAFAEATDNDGWVLNPLPLFTAIGNGRGGGDYYGKNQKKVGRVGVGRHFYRGRSSRWICTGKYAVLFRAIDDGEALPPPFGFLQLLN